MYTPHFQVPPRPKEHRKNIGAGPTFKESTNSAVLFDVKISRPFSILSHFYSLWSLQ